MNKIRAKCDIKISPSNIDVSDEFDVIHVDAEASTVHIKRNGWLPDRYDISFELFKLFFEEIKD